MTDYDPGLALAYDAAQDVARLLDDAANGLARVAELLGRVDGDHPGYAILGDLEALLDRAPELASDLVAAVDPVPPSPGL